MLNANHLHPQGWASTELPESKQRPEGASLAPLLDTIIKLVPPPSGALAADTKAGLNVVVWLP